MNPRLVAFCGPLKDSTFVLPAGEVPVGRDSSNLLCVSDLSVSRRHCVFNRTDDAVTVGDLGSRNGTLVNGVPVRETGLKHGDQVTIGDSVFLFLRDEETDRQVLNPVEFDDDQLTRATAQVRPQDVLYLHPEKVLREMPVNSRMARNLSALLQISRVVHSIRDLEELQQQILSLIFEVSPAERGAILLDGKDAENFTSIFARNRPPGGNRPVRVSRTIALQVLKQGIAILGGDVPNSGDFSGVESLVASQVRSLLCVPMIIFEHVIGCIYLDSTDPLHRFDEDHLQLITAIAGISAVALENARRLQWLESENQRPITEINFEHSMLGESPKMKRVYQFNCAAIPEGLLESELFGHEKGAFTGAAGQKKGRLEVANGGTVFLDEIGEVAPAIQIKLLRVLQEREFERVGGTRPIKVDIRLIAASNRNLEESVQAGTFRRDLYFRLNVVLLKMPPLRERREDIPMLARYFVAKYSKKCNVRQKQISREALARLMNYDWPGNVRELENAIERALVLGSSEVILPEDLPEPLLETGPAPGVTATKYHSALTGLKKQLILNALGEAQGSYTEAARILGVHPNYLHRLIRNLNLKGSLPTLPVRGKTSSAQIEQIDRRASGSG